jgi:hypothetical protein
VGVVMTSRAQKRVLWQQRLADLEASGMTQAAYCAAQGIGYSTLQRWQRRLRREAAALPCAEHDRWPPIVLFDFCASRSGQHAQRFLGDWRGRLMVDDFAGYKALFCTGITELGCWAHARRKFHDLHQASGSLVAQEALNRIAAFYRVEAAAKDLMAEDRMAYRQEHAAPHGPRCQRYGQGDRLHVATLECADALPRGRPRSDR